MLLVSLTAKYQSCCYPHKPKEWGRCGTKVLVVAHFYFVRIVCVTGKHLLCSTTETLCTAMKATNGDISRFSAMWIQNVLLAYQPTNAMIYSGYSLLMACSKPRKNELFSLSQERLHATAREDTVP